MADEQLHIRLLGPVEVRRGDDVVDLGGPQPRAVFTHLVLGDGRVIAADRLIDRIWGDDPPASALGTLQSYVSRLRRAIEPDRRSGAPAQVLVSEAPGYVLRVPRDHVDVYRFEDLAVAGREAAEAGHARAAVERFDAALALWRGPALGGLGGDDSIAPLVARLEEERADVVEDRFDALLALGRHSAIVGSLQEAVREEPLRERRWGQLALALYRSRRQADALRALDTARRQADELGLDPGPELQSLEARVLNHDPSLVATPPPAIRSVPAPTAEGVADAGALVGRRAEWRALNAALDRAAGGMTGLVLVEGEPGIGKTTLFDALTADARGRGWSVAWGRCVEAGLAPALWPWIEVLRAILGGDESALAGRPAVADLVTHAEVESERAAPLVQLAEEIVTVLARAEPPGRIVVLDDLHWADAASLELLALVAARMTDAPVVLAGTHRPLDLGVTNALSDALALLGRRPEVMRISLTGLDANDTGALIAAVGGVAPNEETVARVHDRTGGNPLFVAELTRWASAAGTSGTAVPEAIRDVVRSRLGRLPDRTMSALAIGAVLGQEFELRVLTAASDRDVDDCLDDLDAAMVTRVLVPGESGRKRHGGRHRRRRRRHGAADRGGRRPVVPGAATALLAGCAGVARVGGDHADGLGSRLRRGGRRTGATGRNDHADRRADVPHAPRRGAPARRRRRRGRTRPAARLAPRPTSAASGGGCPRRCVCWPGREPRSVIRMPRRCWPRPLASPTRKANPCSPPAPAATSAN